MKTEINSGMKTTEMLTCGIFYCRDSAEINGYGSLQTSSWIDSDVFRSRQQKHTAVRFRAFDEPDALCCLQRCALG
jgi:hypothetical protein